MLREPRRLGALRSEMFGYALITVLVVGGAIYTLRLFTVQDRADFNASAAVASRPVAKAPAEPGPPAEPEPASTSKYAHTLEEDQKSLPGPWLRSRNDEVKGASPPTFRLRFDGPAARLTCEPLDPNDPGSSRTAYQYEIIEQNGVRYLKLTNPAAPEAEPLYVPYRFENESWTIAMVVTFRGSVSVPYRLRPTTLQLARARPGRMEQDKLVLGNPTGVDLRGTWRRELPPR